MSDKKKAAKAAEKRYNNNNNRGLIIAAAVIVCLAIVFVIAKQLVGSGSKAETPDTVSESSGPVIQEAVSEADSSGTDGSDTDAGQNTAGSEENGDTAAGQNTAGSDTESSDDGVTVIADGEALEIPTADITTTASFYPVEVDGTTMEIIAVRDSSGEIRTAFNTCQICYGSGRGYYEQSGNYLICQNCGNRFSMDQVGIRSGGCNPWPIFDENRTVTDDTVSISYDFLVESKEIFENWKFRSNARETWRAILVSLG